MTDSNDAVLPARSLLEAGELPFADLLRFSEREGRRGRPIYQMHKWFARRLGCAFRTVLVGAIAPETADFWAAYYETATLQGRTVLDPFVGGGTSMVEAQRLGANAVGVDVDPIACAITSLEVEACSLPDLAPTLAKLKRSVADRLAAFYAVDGPNGTPLIGLHYFWVQEVKCSGCGERNEAHPNYVLGEAGQHRWCFCRACHAIHRTRLTDKTFACKECGVRTDVLNGSVTAGALTCSACSRVERLIDHGRKGSRPNWKLFAVEACARTSGRAVPMSERTYLRATDADVKRFRLAARLLRQLCKVGKVALPKTRISRGCRTDTRLTDYGYRQWIELFNARQQLHLALLLDEICKLSPELRRPFGLAFSNHLTTNCMMTAYAVGWRRLTPLFSIRAFRHVPRPVELNPWMDGTGRGSFPNAVRQLSRAQTFACDPKEPARRGGFKMVPAIASDRSPVIVPGNARDLDFVEDDSVDIVLTDPPYYDNVAYWGALRLFSALACNVGARAGFQRQARSR